MKNSEIAAIFDDIAERLLAKKENIFKIRAYQKVARSIESLPVPVEQLVKEYRLNEIPGAGEAISKKLTELVTTGKLEYYEKLKAESSTAPPQD
jgi:DNA polymerase (family 10)